MGKVSQQPPDGSPSLLDYLLGNQNSGPVTKIFTLQTLINFFWTLANIPSGGTNPITRDNEAQFAFIASGLVWSGDSYGSNRNASMTAGIVYINGRRISIAAVTARTFTASVDTYVDVLDNGDGTGTLVYTTATNNAASPALAANSIRIAIIVTGATTIAAAGSVNQGQESKVLPIASSIPYQVTDSLGNLIANHSPNSGVLGLRRRTTTFSTASSSFVDVTELTVPFILASERKVKFMIDITAVNIATNGSIWNFALNVDGTVIQQWYRNQDVTLLNMPFSPSFTKTLAAGSHTAKLQLLASGGTATASMGTDNPGSTQFTPGPGELRVELV